MGHTTQFIYDSNYNLFVALGLGRVRTQKKNGVFLYFVYSRLIRLIYIFTWISNVCDGYLVSNNSEKFVINTCSTLICTVSVLKLYLINYRYELLTQTRENFQYFFSLLYVGKSDEDKQITKKNSLLFLKISKIIYGFTAPVVLMYFTFPAILYYFTGEKQYPLPLPEFFGTTSPTYEIIYTAQSIILIHFLFFVASMDILMCESLIRICENFEILVENIKNLKVCRNERTDDNETVQQIRMNVQHHQNILKQMNSVNQLYSLALFLQVTVGSLLTSFTLFNTILVSYKIRYHLFFENPFLFIYFLFSYVLSI